MSSKMFNSLREIVEHVQLSLNLTNEDRDDANSILVMLLTEKYEGVESAMRGYSRMGEGICFDILNSRLHFRWMGYHAACTGFLVA